MRIPNGIKTKYCSVSSHRLSGKKEPGASRRQWKQVKWRPYCILGSTLTVFWSLSLQLEIKKTTYRWFRNIYIADLASNRVLMRHRSSRNTTKIEPARHLPNRFNFDYFFSTEQNLSKRKFAAVFGVS